MTATFLNSVEKRKRFAGKKCNTNFDSSDHCLGTKILSHTSVFKDPTVPSSLQNVHEFVVDEEPLSQCMGVGAAGVCHTIMKVACSLPYAHVLQCWVWQNSWFTVLWAPAPKERMPSAMLTLTFLQRQRTPFRALILSSLIMTSMLTLPHLLLQPQFRPGTSNGLINMSI